TVSAQLSADARALDATEGELCGSAGRLVDADHTALQETGDAGGSLQVAGMYRGAQAICRVVGQCHGGLLAFYLVYHSDRPKQFFGVCLHIRGHPREDSRFKVSAVAVHLFAADKYRGALIDCVLHLGSKCVEGSYRVHWSDEGLRFGGVSDLQLAYKFDELGGEGIVYRLIHDEAFGGIAGLPGVTKAAKQSVACGRRNIGVIEHDERVRAAEL